MEGLKSEILRNKKLLGKHNKSYANPVYLEGFEPENYIIIDIRHPYDYAQGHICGALNIIDLDKIAKVAQDNVNKKILLHCYSGHTASIYGSELVFVGLENIYYLDENILDFDEHGIKLESE
ncbi:rhodanese-like domain-containing protein [Helicobacter sp. 13S00477-4]|uniref:rhodanese-like domain-containing protein n=1 Tax=Helicobacter sp. 13S00477-4 TaxID=1905759 RepID=UPI000BA66F20|nr:rhodanese-like domain-containing protein [Helicobacter sp. 13S00477-4]PAF50326.1 hypothetical protein BKH44_08405 [Helicobacter sp. 13S00477-4]